MKNVETRSSLNGDPNAFEQNEIRVDHRKKNQYPDLLLQKYIFVVDFPRFFLSQQLFSDH